jgi:hypothetical protein
MIDPQIFRRGFWWWGRAGTLWRFIVFNVVKTDGTSKSSSFVRHTSIARRFMTHSIGWSASLILHPRSISYNRGLKELERESAQFSEEVRRWRKE